MGCPVLVESSDGLFGSGLACFNERALVRLATGILVFVATTTFGDNIAVLLAAFKDVNVSQEMYHIVGVAMALALIIVIVADSYMSRFQTIVVSLVICVVGTAGLVIFAFVQSVRVQECLDTCEAASLWSVRIVTFLVSFGLVLSEACLLGFGADQVFMDTVEYHKYKFSTIYYFMNVFVSVSFVFITYVLNEQFKLGEGYFLLITLGLLISSLLLFISKHRSYRKVPPVRTFLLLRLLQVVVGAYKKRGEILPKDSLDLNHDRHEKSKHVTLKHTKHLRCLDKAAIITEIEGFNSHNTWTLSTVERVEEVKFFIRLMPIWLVFVILVVITEHHAEFSLKQLQTMNVPFLKKKTDLFFSILELSSNIFCLLFYKLVFVPIARKVTKTKDGLTTFQMIGLGLISHLLGIIVAALIENRRLSLVGKLGLSMNGCWLVPEYLLIQLGNMFAKLGITEWLFEKAPESVRSMGWWLYNTSEFVGQLGSIPKVLIIKKATGWIAEDINKGRVDYYDWAMAVLIILDIIVFCAIQRCMRPHKSLGSEAHISPSQASQPGVFLANSEVNMMGDGNIQTQYEESEIGNSEDWLSTFLNEYEAQLNSEVNMMGDGNIQKQYEESEIGNSEDWLSTFLNEYEAQPETRYGWIPTLALIKKTLYDANIPMDQDILVDSMTGLKNLGNTCYMNSAIQCLVHTPQIANYFRGDYYKDINRENPLGKKGELVTAFGELLRELWAPSQKVVAPVIFLEKLSKFETQFSDRKQHDSQELLAFLLNGLHEDLNRVKQRPNIELKDADGRPDEEVADENWANQLAYNDSIIVDLYQGLYKSTLVCPVCDNKSIKFDPFMHLSLPLDLPKVYEDGSVTNKNYTEPITLYSCIEAFLREESLVPEEMWKCSRCMAQRQARKKLDLWRLPEVLVIHLKRFSYRKSPKKLELFVNFPVHNLDMTKYVANEKSPSREQYSLYALTNHYGCMEEGHYTSNIKSVDGDIWYTFDDDHITPINADELESPAAYVLY